MSNIQCSVCGMSKPTNKTRSVSDRVRSILLSKGYLTAKQGDRVCTPCNTKAFSGKLPLAIKKKDDIPCLMEEDSETEESSVEDSSPLSNLDVKNSDISSVDEEIDGKEEEEEEEEEEEDSYDGLSYEENEFEHEEMNDDDGVIEIDVSPDKMKEEYKYMKLDENIENEALMFIGGMVEYLLQTIMNLAVSTMTEEESTISSSHITNGLKKNIELGKVFEILSIEDDFVDTKLTLEERDKLDPLPPNAYLVSCEIAIPIDRFCTIMKSNVYFTYATAELEAKKLFFEEINTWNEAVIECEWNKLSNVENIKAEDIEDCWEESGERGGFANPVAQCTINTMGDRNNPLYIIPKDKEVEKEIPKSLVLGSFPGGGIVMQGEVFYIISSRVCIATYDYIWGTSYRVLFSPSSETDAINVAKELFVTEVDSSWRDGYVACCGKSFPKLQKNGWNIDNVDGFTAKDLRRNWKGDDNGCGSAYPYGPAFVQVEKFHRIGNHGISEGIIYFLPQEELPISKQKSARSIAK